MNGSVDKKKFYEIVGQNIKKYRETKNYTLEILGDKVGLTKKTVSRYEKGEHKFDMERLNDLAGALEIDVKLLLDGAYEYQGIEYRDESEDVSLPIVGRISCGTGGLAFDDVEGYEQTPKSWINGGEYFYLRAKGDSMKDARIFEGDLLLIRKQENVEDGEIAAVLIDDEAVLKRVHRENGLLLLHSANSEYRTIVVTPDSDIKIIGKLIKIVINL